MSSQKNVAIALAIAFTGMFSSCESTPTKRAFDQVPTGVVVGTSNARAMPVPFEPSQKPGRWAQVHDPDCAEIPQHAIVGLTANADVPQGMLEVSTPPQSFIMRTGGESVWPEDAVIGWSMSSIPANWQAASMPRDWAESR